MMDPLVAVLPGMLFGLVWLGVMVYLIVLATRFVSAVERIADSLSGGPRS